MQRGRGAVIWNPTIHIETLSSGYVLLIGSTSADLMDAHAFETLDALLAYLRQYLDAKLQQLQQEGGHVPG